MPYPPYKRIIAVVARDMQRNKALHNEQSKRNNRKAKYGLSHAEFVAMLERQAGLCACCTVPMAPGRFTHIDHCHTTGRVRGIVCHNCNLAIGQLQNDPVRAFLAESYLLVA